MKAWQNKLMINGQRFTFLELLTFSKDKIETANTPPWETELYRFIINWLNDNEFIVQHSSGTTGKTKEIRLYKQSMITSAANTCSYFKLKKGQTALLCLPVTYIAGKMMVVRSIVGELNLQVVAPDSMPDFSSIPVVDFCAMVPLQVINLLNNRNAFLPVKKLIIGGAAISPELENQLQQIPTAVYATYGMAETCSHIAIRRLNGPDRQEAYHALPGVTVTHDERGCLVIAATWLPAQINTNDLVTFTGTDAFTWLGRYDNLINSGGIKTVPEEVEAMIMACTTLECIVIGLPDDKLGQKLVFVFEQDKISGDLSLLRIRLENMLPHHVQPKNIVHVKQFPRNNAFKVDRVKLSAMLTTNRV
jgi:O-succinylbenzoic acid--CoA ligase